MDRCSDIIYSDTDIDGYGIAVDDYGDSVRIEVNAGEGESFCAIDLTNEQAMALMYAIGNRAAYFPRGN